MATAKESLTESAWFITRICTSGIFMNFACALEVSLLSTLVLNDAVVHIALGHHFSHGGFYQGHYAGSQNTLIE